MRFAARRSRRPRLVQAGEGYARWAAVYPPYPHNALMRAEQAAMLGVVNSVGGTTALDLGTGSGRYRRCLAEYRGRLAVGLDLSREMLRQQVAGTADRPSLVCGNALRLPFRAASFDLVVSGLMVGDVDDLDAWLREVARVLLADGRLVYSDFHPIWACDGWRRTFTGGDGRLYELPYVARTIEEHCRALGRAAFDVIEVREPPLLAGDAANLVTPLPTERPVCVVLHARRRVGRG